MCVALLPHYLKNLIRFPLSSVKTDTCLHWHLTLFSQPFTENKRSKKELLDFSSFQFHTHFATIGQPLQQSYNTLDDLDFGLYLLFQVPYCIGVNNPGLFTI